ncbi:SRPBCC family protein [Nocardia sp. NPDC020380]|uniref:SRPBCC family protein n=1 Tax=Nocardia sp. NPDC020380 TaxID=3364309 RepID=UPI003787BC6A
MTVTPTGTYLILDDGRPAVRLTREYDHPIDHVWHLVTDADELAHWFPSRAEIELRPGGSIRFSGDPSLEDTKGQVLSVNPPHHLAFSWSTDELRFDLESLGDNRTRFTLTNVLSAPDTAARNGAGWDVCLGALDAYAAGRDFGGPHAGHTPAWDELYAAYIAAGTPSGAIIPGK